MKLLARSAKRLTSALLQQREQHRWLLLFSRLALWGGATAIFPGGHSNNSKRMSPNLGSEEKFKWGLESLCFSF